MIGVRPTAVVALVGVMLPCVCVDLALGQGRPENDPKSCRQLWDAIGLPENKASGQNQITTVCHLGYITGHNNRTKTPEWVIERLTPKLTTGDAAREDQDFQEDEALPESKRATVGDYHRSGFDQGHQAAAGDFKGDQKFLDDTFFLSNAVPQVGIGFNRSIWRSLETHVRRLVGERKELYVITGAVPQSKAIKIRGSAEACRADVEIPAFDEKSICPEHNQDERIRCSAGVAVPAALYKIVYDPASQTAFAVLLANESHTGKYPKGRTYDYIKQHRIGIGTIEDLTGLTFFTKLPDRKQRQLKTNCVDVKFH